MERVCGGKGIATRKLTIHNETAGAGKRNSGGLVKRSVEDESRLVHSIPGVCGSLHSTPLCLRNHFAFFLALRGGFAYRGGIAGLGRNDGMIWSITPLTPILTLNALTSAVAAAHHKGAGERVDEGAQSLPHSAQRAKHQQVETV